MKVKEGKVNAAPTVERTKFLITPVVGVVQNTLKSVVRENV
jgi:hypothetical protein